jgi:CheY-like chemotaxis protein
MDILLVEDNHAVLDAWSAILGMSNKVACAEDAETGLEQVIAASPQIILLDYNLPGMNGYEFSRSLRTGDRYAPWKDVPIIGIGDFPEEEREYLSALVPKAEFLMRYEENGLHFFLTTKNA